MWINSSLFHNFSTDSYPHEVLHDMKSGNGHFPRDRLSCPSVQLCRINTAVLLHIRFIEISPANRGRT